MIRERFCLLRINAKKRRTLLLYVELYLPSLFPGILAKKCRYFSVGYSRLVHLQTGFCTEGSSCDSP